MCGELRTDQLTAPASYSHSYSRRWKWLKPNDSIIPLGKPGEFDACGVFGAKQVKYRNITYDNNIYDNNITHHITSRFERSRDCASVRAVGSAFNLYQM